ncbi:MAG TPA: hypothetical protein VH394_28515 [Thermoanaerobaculia bacterium]|jgi:hypothetical protein|nr:hypothetical protein [Thermoanaerobaculia bacterium]
MAEPRAEPVGELAPLTREETEFLSAIALRAFRSVLQHREPIGVISREERRREPPSDKLYVASLAFQLPDPTRHSREHRRGGSSSWCPPHSYSTVSFKKDPPSWEDLPRTVEDFLEESKRAGALPHFVLLNELAHAFDARNRLEAKWAELAEAYKVYIIPGTFNCPSEHFSVAPLYCPDPDSREHVLKQNAAIQMKERIRTPDSRELLIFDTDFGNIVVWICLDMYDPGLVMKFLNISHRFTGRSRDREISLVLVPSYSNDDRENVSSCVRTISRFSKTAMVCTNSYLPEKRLESHGFSCGERLQPVLEKAYDLPGLKGDLCRATLFGIDLKELQRHQAANYEANGAFSSAFSSIIKGGGESKSGGYSVHNLPD